MKTEWKATSKESEKGSVIFESCDIEDYNKASEEYNKLSKSQKAQYKGQQQYIEKTLNVQFSEENLKYIRLMQEVELRMKNVKMPEILNIDSILDRRTIRDLLSTLENEEYIKALYREKNLMLEMDLILQRQRFYLTV